MPDRSWLGRPVGPGWRLACAFALGTACHALGAHGFAVVSLAVGYYYLYSGQKRTSKGSWLAHPLRVALPIWLAFQLTPWLRCTTEQVLGDRLPHRLQYQYLGYSLDYASPACAWYLFVHLVYFAALAFAYKRAGSGWCGRKLCLDRWLGLLTATVVLITAVGGFLLTYGRRVDAPLPVLYAVSVSGRLSYLMWMILAFLVATRSGLLVRCGAAIALGLLLLGCFMIVVETGMRFLLVGELMAVLAVWWTFIRQRWLLVAATMFLLSGATLLLLLGSLVKFGLAAGPSEAFDRLDAAVVLEVVDAWLLRTGGFHADAVMLERESLPLVLRDVRDSVHAEFLGGIPFSGLLRGNRALGLRTDAAFQWAVGGGGGEGSFFVSAFTSVRWLYGWIPAGALALLAGLLHGWIMGGILRSRRDLWMIPQAAMLPVALLGMYRWQVIGIPVDCLMFWGVLTVLRRRCKAPATLLAYPDRGADWRRSHHGRQGRQYRYPRCNSGRASGGSGG